MEKDNSEDSGIGASSGNTHEEASMEQTAANGNVDVPKEKFGQVPPRNETKGSRDVGDDDRKATGCFRAIQCPCDVKSKNSIIRCIIGRVVLVIQVLLVINSVLKINMRPGLLITVLLGIVLIVVEMCIIVFKRSGKEWRWCTPCMLLYLICVVPLLWALELDEIDRLRNECDAEKGNVLHTPLVPANDYAPTTASFTTSPAQNEILARLGQAQHVSHQVWKQTFLIVIVITRWILPKGGLSHDELSNLLFIYFAIASDIMELSSFEIFDPERFCEVGVDIFYGILVVWSLSLLQFTIPLSAKASLTGLRPDCLNRNWDWFYETEIWSVVLSVCLQDGPFLCVRLACLVHYKLYSYEIIFFAMKNALIICLQIYRCVIIFQDYRKEGNTDSNLENHNIPQDSQGYGELRNNVGSSCTTLPDNGVTSEKRGAELSRDTSVINLPL